MSVYMYISICVYKHRPHWFDMICQQSVKWWKLSLWRFSDFQLWSWNRQAMQLQCYWGIQWIASLLVHGSRPLGMKKIPTTILGVFPGVENDGKNSVKVFWMIWKYNLFGSRGNELMCELCWKCVPSFVLSLFFHITADLPCHFLIRDSRFIVEWKLRIRH